MSGKAFETLVRERLRGQLDPASQAIGRDRTLLGKWLDGSGTLRLEQIVLLLDYLGIELMDSAHIAIAADEYERLLEAQADLAALKLRLHRERK